MTPRDERGASAVEYSLIAVAIAAVIVAIVFTLGVVTQDSFRDSCSKISSGGKDTPAEC